MSTSFISVVTSFRYPFSMVVEDTIPEMDLEDSRMRFVAAVDMEVEDKLMLVGKGGEDRQLEVGQSMEMVDTLLN